MVTTAALCKPLGSAKPLRMSIPLRATLAALLVFLVTMAILLEMGRPAICSCGEIELWGTVGPKQSQMLADWYSPSHIVHGFLFYGALHLVAPRWPVERRFLVALIVEAAWEVIENTPAVIDRYREATIALGYSGDSILNNVSDIAMMVVGFLAARRLPLWASVLVVLALELIPLLVIRDNLFLNVWMLLAPNQSVLQWQSGA
jgi:hypothetical protein